MGFPGSIHSISSFTSCSAETDLHLLVVEELSLTLTSLVSPKAPLFIIGVRPFSFAKEDRFPTDIEEL